MGYVTQDDEYCTNLHPVAFRCRATGVVRDFWPDTGCPVLLAAFRDAKIRKDRAMENVYSATLCIRDSTIDLLYRLVQFTLDHLILSGENPDRPPGPPPGNGCAWPDFICDSIALEALIVKKMILDNPEEQMRALVAREDFAFAIYRFADHIESMTRNVNIMNFIGMVKMVIDERWNIELETDDSPRLWDIEDASPQDNPNSTPCPLALVFAPRFYALQQRPEIYSKSAKCN